VNVRNGLQQFLIQTNKLKCEETFAQNELAELGKCQWIFWHNW